jgi:hypothetical protein
MSTFKEKQFYYCFDCGWGERGVHEFAISFQQAYDIIKTRTNEETADAWLTQEDNYYEFRSDYYMLTEDMFDLDQWEGSEDY